MWLLSYLLFLCLVVNLTKATSSQPSTIATTITTTLGTSPDASDSLSPTPAATSVKPPETNTSTSPVLMPLTLQRVFQYVKTQRILPSEDGRYPSIDLYFTKVLIVIFVTLGTIYAEWRIGGLEARLKAEQKRSENLSVILEQAKWKAIKDRARGPIDVESDGGTGEGIDEELTRYKAIDERLKNIADGFAQRKQLQQEKDALQEEIRQCWQERVRLTEELTELKARKYDGKEKGETS
ncbi:hypothetical protein DM02DRAFT_612238 [Periconia macrospinosa]|uniref:Endoplasmic reticulum transmembrane protein n=1 Tax=Periconia macrospinosa TaxID=97972 RepID=A0A2V1DYN7_9PLEO|nr:hypothetical protein DM02DRAFT_612238 [Periconia macrospinosa]